MRGSGTIVGYTGVDSVLLDGIDRLEWGWRFAARSTGPGLRNRGGERLARAGRQHDDGEMLCLMSPDNHASRRVADKVGFQWWRRIDWLDDPAEPTTFWCGPIGSGGPPRPAPLRT